MLKAGDQVTLGCNPTIRIGDGYLFLKPHAAIRRTLSDDILGDLQDMQAELRKLLFRMLHNELTAVNDVCAALGEAGDADALLVYCKEEMGDVEGQTTFTVEEAEGETGPLEIDEHGNPVHVVGGAPKSKLKPGKSLFPGKKKGVAPKLKAKGVVKKPVG